uniref:TIR domain containing adaptor protein n=1 Tax=Amphilophus citrinellus TaxID=61819 RepID=A0A3Q0SSP7_AMPCI
EIDAAFSFPLGWLQKLFKSRATLSKEHNQEVTKNSVTSASSSLSSSPGGTPSKPQCLPAALASESRWKRNYDIFVCHSNAQSDIEEATRLVSFLEATPHSLRCFLWQRDTCPGGAMSTEFCQAVKDSHLWVLLITPNFVQDSWCSYMMQQVLSEGPMSNRLIPLLHSLSHSQYPQELKYFYYIDLSKNPDRGYTLVNRAVLKYLLKKEMTHNFNMNGSNSGLDGEDGS